MNSSKWKPRAAAVLAAMVLTIGISGAGVFPAVADSSSDEESTTQVADPVAEDADAASSTAEAETTSETESAAEPETPETEASTSAKSEDADSASTLGSVSGTVTRVDTGALVAYSTVHVYLLDDPDGSGEWSSTDDSGR